MTPKMCPKSSQNRVGIRIGFALCFSLFLAPQMEPTTPENSNITYVKQLFPQIVPFPFDHRFGTKKSKTPPKTIPKTHRKSTPNFRDFGLKMDSQMTPEILQNRHGGHCGPRWVPDGTQRGPKGRSSPPRGPQNGGPGPLRATIFIICGT